MIQAASLYLRASEARRRLDADEPLRILLVNDSGIRFGAGIATGRLAAALLLAGHRVALAYGDALTGVHTHAELAFLETFPGVFDGAVALPMIPADDPGGAVEAGARKRFMTLLEAFIPDVVICGMVHGARWPLEWMAEAADIVPVVALVTHDLYAITGRCPYPGPCALFADEAGCDATCPTAEEYPVFPRDEIAALWRSRGEVLTTPGVCVAANSHWSANQVRRRFPDAPPLIATLPLGLDDLAMTPHSPHVSRRALGIPTQADASPVVLVPAVNFDNPYKGAARRRSMVRGLRTLPALPHLLVVGAFGADADWLRAQPNVTYHAQLHPQMMPLAYGAADLVVLFSKAETFGQTALEAAACARPVAAMGVGGLPEVGLGQGMALVPAEDESALLDICAALLDDPRERARLGRAGRRAVEAYHSLEAVAGRWRAFLLDRLSDREQACK